LPVDLVWIGDGLRHVPGFPMTDLVAQPEDAPGLISTGLYARRTAEQPQDAPADSAPNTPAPNDPSETPPAE